MKLNIFFLVLIFFVNAWLAYSADDQSIELEKIVVSSLPENILAPDLKSVTVDPRGNVFAFAGLNGRKECFIVKFDENLKYLKRFGRNGEGPGEFEVLSSSPENRLSCDTNGDIYVMDYNPRRRLIVFDNEGNYKTEINIDRDYSKIFGKINQVRIIGSGTFIALQYRRDLPLQALIFTFTPPHIDVWYPFIEKKIQVYYSQLKSDSYGDHCFIDADSKYILFGHSQIYKFQVYAKEGNLKLEVHDRKRIMGRFSEPEMKKIIRDQFTKNDSNSFYRNDFISQLTADKALFKKTMGVIEQSKNVIADIKISGERIYVFPVLEDITSEGKYPVEVYNLKGEVVKKGFFKQRPDKIWKDHVFSYARDEEDNPLIVKYKIPNE